VIGGSAAGLQTGGCGRRAISREIAGGSVQGAKFLVDFGLASERIEGRIFLKPRRQSIAGSKGRDPAGGRRLKSKERVVSLGLQVFVVRL
jgi:hypothetical protein